MKKREQGERERKKETGKSQPEHGTTRDAGDHDQLSTTQD
jgi:hypothetical protein